MTVDKKAVTGDATTAVHPATPEVGRAGPLRRFLSWEGTGLLGVLVLVFVLLAFFAPNFLTTGNLLNVLRQAAFFGIVAFAMSLVIISGEIDVSVGSQAALTSSLVGYMVVSLGWSMVLSCLVAIVVAVTLGAFVGWIRHIFNVPTFIGTLALYLALRGAAMLVTNTFPIPIESSKFFFWGTGKFFGVPVAALYLVVAFVVVAFIANSTVFGRSVYAVGGNAKAAEVSGINVLKVRVMVMSMSAFTAAITGLLLTAQLSSGNSTVAIGLEFDAIAAAVIGGTLMSGGKGSVLGTLIGVLFVAILLNGMVLLGMNPYLQQVVRGALVLFAVLINVVRSRRAVAA